MNKLVLMMALSLDGFMEGPDRDISWHMVDEELHTYINDYLRTTGAFLQGRVTHELMVDFWPTADEDPSNPPPVREFAGIWRDKPKFVFSKTYDKTEWNTTVPAIPATTRTTLIASATASRLRLTVLSTPCECP